MVNLHITNGMCKFAWCKLFYKILLNNNEIRYNYYGKVLKEVKKLGIDKKLRLCHYKIVESFGGRK